MQAFPYVAGPMTAGGAPVGGVPHVATPARPPGVLPNITQYPAPQISALSPGGFPGTYPPAASGAFPPGMMAPGMPPSAFNGPAVARVPGPATLGPSMNSLAGPGGVAGVAMAPVTTVNPPAVTGGPHPLPNMPSFPLPQGFPNPFALNQLGSNPQAPALPPQQGVNYTTGPQGYLPGLGFFGSPAAGARPGVPGALMQPAGGPAIPAPPLPTSSMPAMPMFPTAMPAPATPAGPSANTPVSPLSTPGMGSLSPLTPFPWAPTGSPAPAPPPATAFPVLPGATPTASQPPTTIPIQGAAPEVAVKPQTEEPPPPPPTPSQESGPETSPILLNPFWFQLGWQLLQTSAARAALGDHFQRLTEGEHRMKLLREAATCLAGPDLQAAFQDLAARTIDQTRFTERFADTLKTALQASGLLPT